MPKTAAPQVQKANWRLWLRVTTWFCLFVGVAWGGNELRSFLLADPRFGLACDPSETSCATLEIHGATYANRSRIYGVFTPDFGRSVFHLPLAERRRRLLAIDWVRTATLARVWPKCGWRVDGVASAGPFPLAGA